MRDDPPPPERPRRWWLYGAMLAAGVAGYAWTLDSGPKEPSAIVLSSEPPEVPGRPPSPFGNGAVVDSPDRLPEATPSSEVAAAAASNPASAAIAAVADPVEMRAHFNAMRWSGEQPTALAALARQINAQLPSLVARGAVNVGDALELKADLLDVLELDPARRRMQLVAWWQSHPLAVSALDQRDPRAPDFNRRQAAALADWQALRSEDRDAGELQETLQDMREALSPQRPWLAR